MYLKQFLTAKDLNLRLYCEKGEQKSNGICRLLLSRWLARVENHRVCSDVTAGQLETAMCPSPLFTIVRTHNKCLSDYSKSQTMQNLQSKITYGGETIGLFDGKFLFCSNHIFNHSVLDSISAFLHNTRKSTRRWRYSFRQKSDEFRLYYS